MELFNCWTSAGIKGGLYGFKFDWRCCPVFLRDFCWRRSYCLSVVAFAGCYALEFKSGATYGPTAVFSSIATGLFWRSCVISSSISRNSDESCFWVFCSIFLTLDPGWTFFFRSWVHLLISDLPKVSKATVGTTGWTTKFQVDLGPRQAEAYLPGSTLSD